MAIPSKSAGSSRSSPASEIESPRTVPQGAESGAPAPLFRPFEWIQDDPSDVVHADMAVRLACKARDISCGVGDLVAMLEADEVREDAPDYRPLLDGHTRGNLQRLCITSLSMLRDCAEAFINNVQERRDARGAA